MDRDHTETITNGFEVNCKRQYSIKYNQKLFLKIILMREIFGVEPIPYNLHFFPITLCRLIPTLFHQRHKH